jgi:hypothetical protein
VLLIRRIRELLYDQGFTISGARNRLAEQTPAVRVGRNNGDAVMPVAVFEEQVEAEALEAVPPPPDDDLPVPEVTEFDLAQLRAELLSIRKLLDS